MEIGTNIWLEQKLSMSQNQIQSLMILSMSLKELSDFLKTEYLENPIFEYKSKHASDLELSIITYSKSYEEVVMREDVNKQKNQQVQNIDIKQFLLEQLPIKEYNQKDIGIMSYLIDCLDDNGYLSIDIEDISDEVGIGITKLERYLDTLKDLEPLGIFSKDLKACILRQISVLKKDNIILRDMVKNHFEEILSGKISSISRKMDLSTSKVRACIEELADLEPYPMRRFIERDIKYIIPDIIISGDIDDYKIKINDDWVENYSISDYYLRMMKQTSDSELSEYFKSKYERAKLIINSINQRRNTIANILEKIVKIQGEYIFGGGILKPMTMKMVAQELGISSSTVSRAVKGKYLQYRHNTILLKDIFSNMALKNNDKDINSDYIKNIISDIILKENKKKPYSDSKIVELLKQRDIAISRRAVNKYREELGISSSYERAVRE